MKTMPPGPSKAVVFISRFILIVGPHGYGPIAVEAQRNDDGVQNRHAKTVKGPGWESENMLGLGFREEPGNCRHKTECQ